MQVDKDNYFHKKNSILIKGHPYDLSTPKIMGIINCTPDSFYDGGKYDNQEKLEKHITRLINEGADILDVGGFSSRPGAITIETKEEWNRIKPALSFIRKNYPNTIISVDTYRSEIVEKALSEYQIDIVNDISAGNLDSNMIKTIAKYNLPYCIMHMQGTPDNMQDNPQYKNVLTDIIDFFALKIKQLQQAGIHDIIIDPGFGFGKTIEHNYELLFNLSMFQLFERPILAGLSRKSMIWKLLNTSAKDALNGTTVCNTIALQKGASILRVHDVKEAKEIITIMQQANNYPRTI